MKKVRQSGPIAWMARNGVTANLLMAAFLLGGLLMMTQVKQEVFPEFDLDLISINMIYPGASPEEVEQGIVKAIEEEIIGLDGIKRVSSTAREGVGSVVIELLLGANANKALQDVKNAVDSIQSFPEDAERPIVSLLTNRNQVISLVLHGEQSEKILKDLGEKVRSDLLDNEGITLVELNGVRKPEISIEISQENLRKYNMTLNMVARRIDAAALELPGGRVKTEGGEVLVRTTERRDWAREYADLPIIINNDGTKVLLRDIATIKDTFEDTDLYTSYMGEPAVRIDVYRVGDQTPREVSDTVKAYVEKLEGELPPSVSVSIWNDYSEILDDRIDLLVRNAMFGLVLVLFFLGLFLDIRLAFWVTLGIPIAILGSMLFVPAVGVSINMISLFAIIVTIGIVVDDAVVVGENIFSMRQRGYTYMQAAIRGAQQMAMPVTFAILTNIAAFLPLMFVPGITGKFFIVIPQMVLGIFVVSLIEALFILPAHLSHKAKNESGGIIGWLNRRRAWFPKFIVMLRDKTYLPTLRFALQWRYATMSLAVVLLFVTFGLIGSGRVEFSFMPKIESERISVVATLPFGSPVEETRKVQEQLIETANEIIEENGGESIIRGMFSQLGSAQIDGGMVNVGSALGGGHATNVQIYLVPLDDRDISAAEFVREWNRRNKNLVGLETLTFSYSAGPGSGQPISFLITHPDTATLEKAAAELAEALEGYTGVRDIDDGFTGGKEQLDFEMKPTAQSLGITALDLARQVRASFFGAEALRNQRGRDEVRVYVRLPEEERRSVYNVEELIIRAPGGQEIPLKEAATVKRGRSYTEINRVDGKRVLNVTADIEEGTANAGKVIAEITSNELQEILGKYDGLSYLLDGEQRDQAEAMSALGFGFIMALFGIFALLAIPFKSYFQPIIIMISIPFGIVGAVIGHMVMGYELSIISMFGIIALAGVVVNGGLLLINQANKVHWAGDTPFNAAMNAGKRRFRPIVLTSMTTFIGLAPMIFETSLQARFLIPMAISLGFGILFSTGISLVLIPCLFLIIFDFKKLLGLSERNEDQITEMKMMAEKEGVTLEEYLSDEAEDEEVA